MRRGLTVVYRFPEGVDATFGSQFTRELQRCFDMMPSSMGDIKMWKTSSSIICAVMLSACGFGAVSPETTRANLALTNIDSVCFPWEEKSGVPGVGSGITKRWELPVPVKTNGDPRAKVAMDTIETELGKEIFDRESIQNVPISEITRGLIFSKGTAFIEDDNTDYQSRVANVSVDEKKAPYPADFFNAKTGVISTRLYINLDNAHAIAKPDEVVHELGHALGFGAHFYGFSADKSDPISKQFWAALKTLYNNPPGTPKTKVELAE